MDMTPITVVHSDNPVLPLAGRSVRPVMAMQGETVAELLIREGLHPGRAAARVWVDGMMLDREHWAEYRLTRDVHLQVQIDAAGGGGSSPLRIVLTLAVMVFAWYAAPYVVGALSTATGIAFTAGQAAILGSLASGLINVAGGLLINSLIPPPQAKIGGGIEALPNATYSLQGGENRARPFEPMPLVFGLHKVYPDFSAKPYTWYSDNEQWMRLILCYGLTDMAEPTDHWIGDTWYANYADVTTEWAANGAALSGVGQNVETENVATDLTPEAGWSGTSPTPTLTGSYYAFVTADDTVVIQVDVIGQAYATLKTTTGTDSVNVEIQYRAIGAGSWTDTATLHLANDDPTEIRRSHRWAVTKGTYDVRLRAVGSYYDPNASYTSRTRRAIWANLVSFQSEPASFAGQNRLGLTVRASGQLNGLLPRWSSLIYARCSVWDGTTWSTAHTRNPAFWFLDFARGRRDTANRLLYGADLDDARIDLDAIKAWGAWCDAQTPPYRIDYVLDTQRTCAEVLALIARCGRASPTWSAGVLSVIWESATDVPVALFGLHNIRKGSFQVAYISEELADEIEASFVDLAEDFQLQTLRVPVPGGASPAVRTLRVDLPGVVERTAALREARLIAASQYYHRRRITWETDVEGLLVARGDIVQLSHDLTQWSSSGRVTGWDAGSRTLTFDRSVSLSADDWINLRWPNGYWTTIQCEPGTGTSASVILATDPPTVDDDGAALAAIGSGAPYHDWAYQFGPQVTPGKRVRIVSIRPLSQHHVQIEAIDDDPGYYAYADGSFTPITRDPLPDLTPRNLSATERLLRLVPGGAVSSVSLTWDAPSGTEYVIRRQLSRPIAGVYTVTRTWEVVGSSQGNTFAIEANERDLLQFEISPLVKVRGTFGAATVTYTVVGRAFPPNDVANFEARIGFNGVELLWDAVDDVDVVAYRIRRGAAWSSAVAVGQTAGLQYLAQVSASGSYTWLIKAVDSSGNESTNAASATLTVSAPGAPANLQAAFYDTALTAATVTLAWDEPAAQFPVSHYIITPGTATAIRANTTSITLPANWTGNRTFTVQAVDIAGLTGAAASLVVAKAVPNAVRSLRASAIYNTVTIAWFAPLDSTLPVHTYEVRRGSTWAGGDSIGTKSGLFTTVTESAAGDYTYWVAAIDTDGNTGAASSVTLAVGDPPLYLQLRAAASTFAGTKTNWL